MSNRYQLNEHLHFSEIDSVMVANPRGTRAAMEKEIERYDDMLQAGELGACSVYELRAHEVLIDDAYIAYKNMHEELLPAADATQIQAHFDAGVTVRNKYAKIKGHMAERAAEQQPPQRQPEQMQPVVRLEQSREPHIGVFDGSPQAWINFRDIFKAEVAERADLADVIKLRYLQDACIQQAAQVLGPWARTDVNFQPAWKTLTDHYDDEHTMQQALVKKIFELEHLKVETYDNLSNIVNVVQGCLRQLKVMGIEIQHWDPMIMYILSKVLPPSTMDIWEQTRETDGIPNLEQFITFVQGRARGRMYTEQTDTPKNASRAVNSFNNINNRPNRAPPNDRRASFGNVRHNNDTPRQGQGGNQNGNQRPQQKPNEQNLCVMCREPHPLYRCPKFLSAVLAKRAELLKQWGLCENCLRVHPKGACNWGPCVRCPSEYHNSVMCPKNYQQRAQAHQVYENRKSRQRGKKRSSGEADLE